MIVYLLRSGKRFKIYSLGTDDSIEYLDYLASLNIKDQNRFETLIHRLVEIGEIHDKRKFRNLNDGIYELKTSNAKRIYCFWSNNKYLTGAIIISHGTDKLSPNKLKREKSKILEKMNKFKNCTPDIRTIPDEGNL
jgi:phage-related protein